MEQETIVRITCDLYKAVSHKIINLLEKIGILVFNVQSAKNVVLNEKKSFLNISKDVLEEDLSDIIFFYIPLEYENVIMSLIVKEAELNHPGRGTVYSEIKKIYFNNIKFFDLEKINEFIKKEKELSILLQENFVEITAIVQRGESPDIVRNILDMGICVPRVTFGRGGGVRSKLGLLRIAIPSEKDIVTVLVNKFDSTEVMNNLLVAAKIDQPAKGFIYMSPVKKIVINTKLFRGKSKHVASMEQMISAIDELKGNNNWRIKFSNIESNLKKRTKYHKGQVCFMVISNGGFLTRILNNIMKSGGTGATVYDIYTKSLHNSNKAEIFILPKREMANIVIDKKIYDNIFSVMVDNGIFSRESSGIVEVSDVIQSCTYFPS